MCPGRHPPPPPRLCLPLKTRMSSPRRQQPVYQGPDASCRAPPVRLRTSRWQTIQSRRLRHKPQCGIDRTRRPIADRMDRAGGQRSLVVDCYRRGDGHPRFCRRGYWRTARKSAQAQIHLIAIRKSRPWPEGRERVGTSIGPLRGRSFGRAQRLVQVEVPACAPSGSQRSGSGGCAERQGQQRRCCPLLALLLCRRPMRSLDLFSASSASSA